MNLLLISYTYNVRPFRLLLLLPLDQIGAHSVLEGRGTKRPLSLASIMKKATSIEFDELIPMPHIYYAGPYVPI